MTKAKKKVYVVGGDGLVVRMFETRLGSDYEVTPKAYEADLVCFTGGEDVWPELYGREDHPTTYFNVTRDLKEEEFYYSDYFVKNRIPKVGICRGAQFLCVMNGGELYQDVDRHAIWGEHELTYTDEKGQNHIHMVTSTHHQMQNPYSDTDLKFELWGFAERCTYRDSETVERKPLSENAHPDVEIVYWPETRCLGFQPHPEYDSESTLNLFKTCLDRLWSRI